MRWVFFLALTLASNVGFAQVPGSGDIFNVNPDGAAGTPPSSPPRGDHSAPQALFVDSIEPKRTVSAVKY